MVFDFGILYSYDFYKSDLIFDNINDISNKFQDIPIKKHNELKQILINDRNKFIQLSQEYLDYQEVINSIKEIIEKCDKLINRDKILNNLLNFYKIGEFELFCNLAPAQIEGIIFDYCIELGINERDITGANSSMYNKFNKMKEKNNEELDFKYYTLKFPIIRNQVAHGKIIFDDDSRYYSWILLNDLLDVCEKINTIYKK